MVSQCTAIVLLVTSGASAQLKESIIVSHVDVPVIVVDRSGNPVRGLQAKDFEVLDQGKVREIRSFDVVDFASAQPVTPTSPLNPVARRNFLLLFDLTFSSPLATTRAQLAASNFLKTMVGPRDRVGVATIDTGHGFRLLSGFTTDRRLILAAIAGPRSFRPSDPLQIAAESPTDIFTELPDPDAANNKFGLNDDIKDIFNGAARINDDANRQTVERQISLLTGLATTLRAVSGQKHVIFLSEGFESRLVQGRDAHGSQLETAAKANENAAVEAGRIWDVNNNDRYGSSSSMDMLTKLSEAARRSDVILDAIDIRGLRSEIDPRTGVRPRSNEGLHSLADPTGGTVFQNSNDLSSDFGRVLKAQEVVYVVGFQTSAEKPGKFHALKVRVNVPGARVTARTGYYEAGGENPLERSLTNAEVVLNDIPQESIRVLALAAPFLTSGKDAQVPVIVEVNGADLLAASGATHALTAEIFIYAFDKDGLVRDFIYQRAALDLNKIGSALKSGIKYYATLSLPPGSYAIKSLVNIAETAKKGFARNDVVVPNSTDFAISQPLFLDEPGQWLMLKGGSHDKTNSGYPFVANGQAFIPSAGVRVRSGEPRTFVVFVRNASPDELSFETHPSATMVSQDKSGVGSLLVFRLNSAGATPSTLEVIAQRRDGAHESKSSIPLMR